mgnify:CR=1 FL=1
MKYDIIYSITAHEHIASVFGMYENIVKLHRGLAVLVVVHCEEPLYALKDTIPQRENLLFNPIRTKKERFSSSIFFAHLDNYNLVSHHDFDFFCTLSSNNMFVRQVDLEDINKSIGVLDVSPTGYSLGDKEMWMWEEFVKNEALVSLFKKYDIGVMVSPHPGTYYRKGVINFIVSFCPVISPTCSVKDFSFSLIGNPSRVYLVEIA